MRTVCVHIGAVQRGDDPDPTPFTVGFTAVPGFGQLLCEGDSFVEWGEPADHLPWRTPRRASIDIDVLDVMSRRDWDQLIPALLDALEARVLPGWRLVDYVVVTDAEDHSRDAQTIGRWGA